MRQNGSAMPLRFCCWPNRNLWPANRRTGICYRVIRSLQRDKPDCPRPAADSVASKVRPTIATDVALANQCLVLGVAGVVSSNQQSTICHESRLRSAGVMTAMLLMVLLATSTELKTAVWLEAGEVSAHSRALPASPDPALEYSVKPVAPDAFSLTSTYFSTGFDSNNEVLGVIKTWKRDGVGIYSTSTSGQSHGILPPENVTRTWLPSQFGAESLLYGQSTSGKCSRLFPVVGGVRVRRIVLPTETFAREAAGMTMRYCVLL